MNAPQPSEDPRPDLRLVGNDAPVDWRVPGYSLQRADQDPPPDDVTACAFAEQGCPICAAEQDAEAHATV